MKEYKITYEGEDDLSERLTELGFEVVHKLRLVEPSTYFVQYKGKALDEAFSALDEIKGLEYCLSKEYKAMDG